MYIQFISRPMRSFCRLLTVVGAGLLALIWSGTALAQNAYVPNNFDNTVSVIETATNTITATVTVGSLPVGVAVTSDGTRVYVTNYSDGNVSVINTATNAVTATLTVGISPSGFGQFIGPAAAILPLCPRCLNGR